MPLYANPGCVTLGLVRLVNTGAPVATLSLRKSSDGFWPALPSLTYIRVLPFGSRLTAIAARLWMIAALIDGLICVQVAPASLERQTPRA